MEALPEFSGVNTQCKKTTFKNNEKSRRMEQILQKIRKNYLPPEQDNFTHRFLKTGKNM